MCGFSSDILAIATVAAMQKIPKPSQQAKCYNITAVQPPPNDTVSQMTHLWVIVKFFSV